MAKPAKSFDKFINKPVKGAKVKEAIRQEKKAAVRERREAIEKHFEAKRQQKQVDYEARQQQMGDNPRNSKSSYPKKSSEKAQGPRGRSGGSKVGKNWDKPAKPRATPEERPYKKAENSRSTDRSNFKADKNFKKSGPEKKPFQKEDKPQRERIYTPNTEGGYKKAAPAREERTTERPAFKPTERTFDKPKSFDRPATKPAFKKADTPVESKTERPKIAVEKQSTTEKRIAPAAKYERKNMPAQSAPTIKRREETRPGAPKPKAEDETMPLNKFLAHAGICSRRDAADKVKQGLASVNGEVITEPAFKVSDTDIILYDGQKIKRSNNLVYILLNKPKDTITTSEDPQGRKTVMDIVRSATQERVYPVGRLDRNTSGVLLLTNDGDLAQHLSHPSFEVRKIYEVRLDKALTKGDFDKIMNGLTLEDGLISADSLAYSDPKDKTIIGIEIHSGRNRIVRRMFEHLGYDVRGLDRVMYANLTKKNVERGHWRFLNEKEVRLLKYFNKSKKGTTHQIPQDFDL
jgi:23S rRNA pseudouridine2605 synthase